VNIIVDALTYLGEMLSMMGEESLACDGELAKGIDQAEASSGIPGDEILDSTGEEPHEAEGDPARPLS